mmetsp:Transcript_13340/g.37942  ORF Transcript_13340/g.37942 Transcript_13340/m.37942 type:complete len:492 (-) Transcript_13340:1157-2632(-)|eukprot:CAMPEP_0119128918 /NCGR_PEP_ID=MMETSP1310-20130426/6877_1 /TAXON_ID=464262 /ORGANISM="Genus nov. species nov., Strain RCC2339" /LENGTH=491 /DNA_ID=CAMNT_0007119303 /DNA_START=177 /DNA_END=1652 /DNA_ORIENTATION=-
MAGKKQIIGYEEVTKHNTKESCWLIIHGEVYDLTGFLQEHPGGSRILLKNAGGNATSAFSLVHSKDVLSQLKPENHVGTIDVSTLPQDNSNPHDEWKNRTSGLPPLANCINIFDFESLAKKVMTKEGWTYYSSGADDEITLRENHRAFQRIWLRPRVMVNVRNVSTQSTILGFPTSFPVYITATALGKLGHPDGEVAFTRACAKHKIVQMCPTLGSCSIDEMASARNAVQVQFFQLYVNPNRKVTEETVRRAERLGYRALAVTVDAPSLGRREKDLRMKAIERPSVVEGDKQDLWVADSGTSNALSAFIDPSLCWDDIAWLRSITDMPIVLKGIQCAEDAVLAVRHGVKAIVVSNHGGRQLDCAPTAIEVLPEIMSALREIGAQEKMEVYLDGGVRRGTDVYKALALGAKAVGIGRPSLYSLATYGQAGVEHMLSLLCGELRVAMMLMGVTSIDQISASSLRFRDVLSHTSTPDTLFDQVYEPNMPVRSKL